MHGKPLQATVLTQLQVVGTKVTENRSTSDAVTVTPYTGGPQAGSCLEHNRLKIYMHTHCSLTDGCSMRSMRKPCADYSENNRVSRRLQSDLQDGGGDRSSAIENGHAHTHMPTCTHHSLRSSVKLSVRKNHWSEQCPQVDEQAHPGRSHLHPDRWPVLCEGLADIRTQGILRVGPAGDEQHEVESCQHAHEVEEGVAVRDGLLLVVIHTLVIVT
eukprot:scpid49434/ scgid14943/ 